MAEQHLRTPPAIRWVPKYELTNGDIAAEVGAQVGLVPDADQRMLLDDIFAESSPGKPLCFETGIVGPRQNIKTSTLEIAVLTDIFVMGDELIVWTAHLFKTARKAFQHMVNLIDSNADFSRRCRKPRTAHGDEAIELISGQAIEFHARATGGGRGLTGNKVVLDEALFLDPGMMGHLLPLMATIPSAQVLYGSSAGLAKSDVLRDLRERAKAGGDPSMAYTEWASPRTKCASDDCPHKPVGVVEGCALDNRALWRQANPAYGRRISEEMLAKFRRAMPPEEFMREFLGWWDEPAAVLQGIPMAAWALRADKSKHPAPIVGDVVFAVDIALDRSRTSIGLAGLRADRRIQIETPKISSGTEWVADYLVEKCGKWNAPVALDATGPAASLKPKLEEAGLRVIELPRSDVVQACGNLVDLVNENGVVHLDDVLLNSAVESARLRTGEAYVFTRRGGDISPLYAVTLASWVVFSQNVRSVYEERGLVVL